MNRLKTISVTTAALLVLSQPISVSLAQQSKFDMEIPTQEVVRISLEVANRLSTKGKLTADEIRQIYFAEKTIGRCVWGTSAASEANYGGPKIGVLMMYPDSSISRNSVQYIQAHPKEELDIYLDVYSKEEIDQWPAECERLREEFIRGRSQLLMERTNKDNPGVRTAHCETRGIPEAEELPDCSA